MWLQATAGALVVAILVMSLTHVAPAIEHITGAPSAMAIALATAIDASLVCCEITHVLMGVSPLVLGIIAAVAVASAALNVYAFRLSQQARRR